MIIISSSLPKSGSTLIANYQEDLLRLVAPRNGQAQLRQVFKGRFIRRLDPVTVARLLTIHARYGSIVIKTHSGVNPLISALIGMGVAKATYCYRDPRDVVLSAIDHGNRTRRGEDPSGAFKEYESVTDSIPKVQLLVQRWRGWHKFGKALFIRYEDLMADKLGHLRGMVSYLGWELPEDELVAMVDRHTPKRGVSHNFNKGTTFRYKAEMTPEQIAQSTAAFRDILVQYRYELV